MLRNTHAHLIVATLLAAVHGCETSDYNRHADVPPSIDKPLSAIPGDAQIVAQTPSELSFRAPADGMVYLYDATDKKTIDAKRIARGRIYQVLPDRSMVRAGERVEAETQLRPMVEGREYRIYFSPAQKGSSQAR